MKRKALISGASIAGPVTAYWLAKAGWEVVVIEKSENLRLGGQNIDFTDAAIEVVDRMGLTTAVKNMHTGEKGLQFVDTNNVSKADFPAGNKSWTREIEIIRGDLVEIFVSATKDDVEYRFGKSIKKLVNHQDHVSVTFNDGAEEDFTVVIAADGMNSSTRSLILGEENHVSYIGCWASYFTIPRIEKDNNWWRWYTSPTGIVAFLRPDNKGSMRASVNFLDADSSTRNLTLDEKKVILQNRMMGAGWECDRISDALKSCSDVFLGPLHQVKATSWHNGKCVLVGDAAYCPTPYTGMGTTLAIIGAYILAQEIASNENVEEAFRKYEGHFRTYAESAQKLAPGVPYLAYARSKIKVKLFHLIVGVGASKIIQKIMGLMTKSEKNNKFILPEYF